VTQANINTLQTIIGEFKNICPELTNTFIFKETGEIVACNENTTEDQSKKTVDIFNAISLKAAVMGRIETLSYQGANKQLEITSINDHYLADVHSRGADEKIIKSLTVIVGAALKPLESIGLEVSEEELPQTAEPEQEFVEDDVPPSQEQIFDDPISEVQATFNSEPSLPVPTANQFMVEKIGGLLVASDTVRIDSGIIAKWRNLYGNKQITQIYIETLEGKTATCKFKPVKEANNNAQGIIQIPERILQTLQSGKGKLVIVKPVITLR
jgi:hypothetical protein